MLGFLSFYFVFVLCNAQTRKVSVFVNPGCFEECQKDKNVLIHVVADGRNDALHHIWDFSYKPTVLFALTPLKTDLLIDWKEFLHGKTESIRFSSTPFYVFSFVLDKVIEFNDINNTANYDPTVHNDSTIYKAHDFDWKFEKFENSSSHAFVVMEGIQHHDHKKSKGVVTITLSAYGTEEHSKIQPHLLHTDNATQIDIVLDGFPTNKHFKSKFALIFSIASSDSSESLFNKTEWKSLDDEHSPGVFTVATVKASRGYLEWRRVAYTTNKRLMTSSTSVKSSLLKTSDNSSLNHTAISSLFGMKLDTILTGDMILTLGQPADSADYSASPYLSWTFLGGIGAPVTESFSLLVVLTVAVGIALPTIIIIIGTICITVKRFSKKSQEIVFAEY